MTRLLSAILGMMLVALVGCQSTGQGVVTYKPGTAPILQQATADGEYGLYDDSLVNFSSDPKATFYLHRGDPLGFKTGKTGEIIIVAGDKEITEPDSGYVWRRKDPAAAATPAPATPAPAPAPAAPATTPPALPAPTIPQQPLQPVAPVAPQPPTLQPAPAPMIPPPPALQPPTLPPALPTPPAPPQAPSTPPAPPAPQGSSPPNPLGGGTGDGNPLNK
jgi:hypothetical protein